MKIIREKKKTLFIEQTKRNNMTRQVVTQQWDVCMYIKKGNGEENI